jgi:excisionase family DNA binding protein
MYILRDAKNTGNPGRPELIAATAAAVLLGISTRHLLRLRDMGDIPAPLKIGRSVRWRRAELRDWLSAGCPSPRRTGWTWNPSN